jgi:hypothetical protein
MVFMDVWHGPSLVSGEHSRPGHEFNQDKLHGSCQPSTLLPVWPSCFQNWSSYSRRSNSLIMLHGREIAHHIFVIFETHDFSIGDVSTTGCF